jgi:uncharacterized protein (TIGR00299 family) protein
MRILYFDCIAGISGDMALGALIDAGADVEAIRAGLDTLPVEPFELEVERADASGIGATQVQVHVGSSSVIRTYASIRDLIEASDLPADAKNSAQRIFRRLAEAEAKVHRKEVELVTFHEVGAVDSIVDIAGTAYALSLLGVHRVFSSPVPTGMGMTRSEHGAMPIPAPAVTELLQGVPIYSKDVPFELTTPTGAAILAALSEGYGDVPLMRLTATGYGAGTYRLGFPNVTRVLIGEAETAGTTANVPARAATGTDVVIETNVDDLNPEIYPFIVERLLEAGAQDAWLQPIVMKKGRPAVTVKVLCAEADQEAMRRILFRETGTLGVRISSVAKNTLDRDWMKVETSHGTVSVKLAYLEGRVVNVAPEFEDCARIAREAGVPARDVYDEAKRLAEREVDQG